MPISADCLQNYTGSLGHLASRTVVPTTRRNTQQSRRRGEKNKRRQNASGHWEIITLPYHPHTEFVQIQPPARWFSESYKHCRAKLTQISIFRGKCICLLVTVRFSQCQRFVFSPNRAHLPVTNKHHRLVNISSAVASYLINTDFFGKLSINIESENLEFRSKVLL